jgi:hypothetical protein
MNIKEKLEKILEEVKKRGDQAEELRIDVMDQWNDAKQIQDECHKTDGVTEREKHFSRILNKTYQNYYNSVVEHKHDLRYVETVVENLIYQLKKEEKP